MRKTPSIKGSFVAPHRLFREKKKSNLYLLYKTINQSGISEEVAPK